MISFARTGASMAARYSRPTQESTSCPRGIQAILRIVLRILQKPLQADPFILLKFISNQSQIPVRIIHREPADP